MFYMLDTINSAEELCGELSPALRIVGIVYKGIQIVVPIILIIVGMLDFAKAVTEKNEDKIMKPHPTIIAPNIIAIFLDAHFFVAFPKIE